MCQVKVPRNCPPPIRLTTVCLSPLLYAVKYVSLTCLPTASQLPPNRSNCRAAAGVQGAAQSIELQPVAKDLSPELSERWPHLRGCALLRVPQHALEQVCGIGCLFAVVGWGGSCGGLFEGSWFARRLRRLVEMAAEEVGVVAAVKGTCPGVWCGAPFAVLDPFPDLSRSALATC